MSVFRPFYYSASYFNTYTPDPEAIDQDANCREWQEKVGNLVSLNDITLLLYHTPPETFKFSYQNKSLAKTFEGNTFINYLLKPEHKELLRYLDFAKQMEYSNFKTWGKWESWSSWHSYSNNSDLYFSNSDTEVEEQLPAITDPFLQMRYAFLLLRLRYQQGLYDESLKLYNTYFADRKGSSIIQQWALLFKALCTDRSGDHVTANYLYSLVFDRCNEKKLSVMQNFNSRPGMIDSTLALAQNNYERGVILTMSVLHYPGPSLDKLQQIRKLIPNSDYLQLLVMREINKLEDWIFTPIFTQYPPSVNIHGNYEWYNDYSKVKEVNYKKDIAYLRNLIIFLKDCDRNSSRHFRNFLNMSLAHLYFIDDQIENGKLCLAGISDKSDVSILTQKNIELSLIELKSGNTANETTRDHLLKSIKQLELLAAQNTEIYKNLYSLARIISGEFEKANDYATAGLLFMKSEHYKNSYEQVNIDFEYGYKNYYWYIGYFDRKAAIEDMDRLINLLKKKNKTPFEKYLCDQKLGSIDAYKELKGTMAFRNNDLDLAYKTYSELSGYYWQKNYEFKNYLNEDPFQPKCWQYVSKRHFNYLFSKTEFVKELISLRNSVSQNPGKNVDKCMKLAHAYYNCSYWGNSWMMASYGQASDIKSLGYTDYLFGSPGNMLEKIQENNYYECTIAKKYYQKVREYATNDEQRALASLMIYFCNDNRNSFYNFKPADDTSQIIAKVDPELFVFYKQWGHTKTFARFHCPLLDEYVENGLKK